MTLDEQIDLLQRAIDGRKDGLRWCYIHPELVNEMIVSLTELRTLRAADERREAVILLAAKEITGKDKCPFELHGVCARKLDAETCPLENAYFPPRLEQVWDCWQIRWKSLAAFDEAAEQLLREKEADNG